MIAPGQGSKDRARAAIQILSGRIPQRRIYTHTGWRQDAGTYFYLHGGGALGANGSIEGIEVQLPSALEQYVLSTSDRELRVQRGSVLNQAHDAAIRDAGGSLHGADDTGEDNKKGRTKSGKIRNTGEILDKARQAMCAEYYDVRTFGSVLANKAGNDEVRGPVQIGIAFSFHPVLPQRIGITRVAATEAQEGKENKTMGNKWIVPYALYQANGHISVPLARKTGFSDADLDLLWEALSKCFEHDRSATRGMMTARRLIVFRHDDYLGNAPAARLFERIKVARTDDPGKPLIGYDQYSVAVDRAGIPKTVEVIEKV